MRCGVVPPPEPPGRDRQPWRRDMAREMGAATDTVPRWGASILHAAGDGEARLFFEDRYTSNVARRTKIAGRDGVTLAMPAGVDGALGWILVGGVLLAGLALAMIRVIPEYERALVVRLMVSPVSSSGVSSRRWDRLGRGRRRCRERLRKCRRVGRRGRRIRRSRHGWRGISRSPSCVRIRCSAAGTA